MKITEQKKNSIMKISVWALFLVTAIVLFVTHRAVPFMMDDLWYATMLSSEEPIRNLYDIWESQVWHYHNWGGRSITHSILQMTLLAGELPTDILNVCMTFLLGVVICQVAEIKKKPWKPFALWAAVSMLVGLNANWKMSMFWQAGAANYLYITVFILWYLHCYLRELEGCPKLPGITFWMIPLGVIAGWSNENMGPAVWLTGLVIMYMVRKEGRKLPVWMILGNMAALAGSVMVIAAPGNFVRSAQTAETEYGTLWKCFLRCYAESKAALEFLFPVLLILVMMLFVVKAVMKIAIGKKNLLLLFCALMSWGAMILSPHYPDRATFGTMVLLICVIVSLSKKMVQKQPETGAGLFGAAILVWLRGMFYLGEFLAIGWGWIK